MRSSSDEMIEKIIKVETEWKLTSNDDGTVTVKPVATPTELSDAADEMRKPKRPEPYTRGQLCSIYMDDPGDARESLWITIEADRKRQAEIAAWDAKYGDNETDELKWVEAPEVYPSDGLYWYKLSDVVMGVELEISGDKVCSMVTHIAGPVEPPKD